MSSPLRVVVADGDPAFTEHLRGCLSLGGHRVVGAAEDGHALIDLCQACEPDLVVCGVRMPVLGGVAATAAICHSRPVPVILIGADDDPEGAEQSAASPAMGYLAKPVRSDELLTEARLAVRRFAELAGMRRELQGLRKALGDRKVIERAKGVLMRKAGLGEAEAFRRMQRMARDSNRRLADIADSILTAEEALQPPGGRPDDQTDKDRPSSGANAGTPRPSERPLPPRT